MALLITLSTFRSSNSVFWVMFSTLTLHTGPLPCKNRIDFDLLTTGVFAPKSSKPAVRRTYRSSNGSETSPRLFIRRDRSSLRALLA
ncbi:hypothetical protein B0H16DRAFT_1585292 [Mycena metata]|uniref:Uncharacterized protein n=1 Tax=Mycena metata TaxID=1033252 RepID=A0AAD7HXH6_9AGAR|nr:hypothetical protein B0H16DRAFT_1585292 [Mycena metata]